MRKIFILLTVLFLYACGSDDKTTVNVTDPYTPPIITPDDPDDPICGNAKIISFYDSGTVYFFDGSGIYTFKVGESVPADFRSIVTDGVKYQLDQYGNIQSQETLPFQPDFCVVDLDENLWTANIIDPETAYNRGNMYAYYLDVYKNNVLFNTLKIQATDMLLSGSDVIVITNTGVYIDIQNVKTGINYAGEFTVHDFNSTLRTAKIDGVSVSWLTNWFNGAKEWNNGYSWNGYTFLNNTLVENGSCLTMWRLKTDYPITLTENAVVISAGSAIFNTEKVLFFIECNSGWLFRYIPASDTLLKEIRLYTGDGLRDTGILYSKILNPISGSDGLYFKFSDGSIYRYRFDSKQIGFIGYCDRWMKEWE